MSSKLILVLVLCNIMYMMTTNASSWWKRRPIGSNPALVNPYLYGQRLSSSASKLLDDPLPVPKCKNNQSFCEDPEFYPEDKFRAILSQQIHDSFVFDSQKIEEQEDFIMTHRRGGGEEYICPSYKRTMFPKIAENLLNISRYIINFEGYRQGVVVEVCESENACNLFSAPPMGIVTKCKQKYIERKLISVDDSGLPNLDYFVLPSTCVCSYKKRINFLRRL